MDWGHEPTTRRLRAVDALTTAPAAATRKGVGAEAAEGLLLLANAARMQLKNVVLVDVLTSDGAVDAAAWSKAAREVLLRLSAEARTTERRLSEQLRDTRERRGAADHEHDYRAGDFANLDRRRRVARKVRKRLVKQAADPRRVAELVAGAQADAWQEISTAAQLLPEDGTTAPFDQRLIDARLHLLTSVDLPALAAARGRRRTDRAQRGATGPS